MKTPKLQKSLLNVAVGSFSDVSICRFTAKVSLKHFFAFTLQVKMVRFFDGMMMKNIKKHS